MSWFDVTPLGRIMNRFSKVPNEKKTSPCLIACFPPHLPPSLSPPWQDLDSADNNMPFVFQIFVRGFFQLAGMVALPSFCVS